MVRSGRERSRWCLAAGVGLALAGCSGGAKSPTSQSPVLRVVAVADGYQCPRTIPSGMIHVAFENRDTTTHEIMFIRLAPGMSAADYMSFERSGTDFPEGAVDCSGIGLTGPGERVEAWLRLEPGEYFLACWFRNHLEHARVQTLTVMADSTQGVEPPPVDATVRLSDFRFDLRDSISRGVRVLRAETLGPSKHEMDLYRLDEGKSLADLRAWIHAKKHGLAPAKSMGGVLDSHELPRVVWLRRDFPIGRYVMWCDMPMVDNVDIPNGKHSDAGMVREFEVR